MGVRWFTEANEGKDEGDDSLIEMRGADAEDELDCYRIISGLNEPGQNVSMLRLHGEEESSSLSDRTPVGNITHSAMCTIDGGTTPSITFYEPFNPKTAIENGVFRGMGPQLSIEVLLTTMPAVVRSNAHSPTSMLKLLGKKMVLRWQPGRVAKFESNGE